VSEQYFTYFTLVTAAEAQNLAAAAVPIKSCSVGEVEVKGQRLAVPVVQVDERTRPDVADLPRVHLTETASDFHHWWHFVVTGTSVGYALCDIEVRRPVTCLFRLAFTLPTERPFLIQVVQARGLGLVDSAQRVLLFPMQTAALVQALAATEGGTA